MTTKNSKITVQGIDITITNIDKEDYICLTDMVKAKEGDSRAADVIKNWIRNRATIEFLGTWESLYNPNFKVVEFDHFRKEAGLHTFTMSVNNWVDKTGAIGIFSKSGKYGGTYAHRDIAFEFGTAISPVFKLFVFKEYQRLKEAENNKYNLEWNVRRVLSKVNYHIHTDAVNNYIIPKLSLSQKKEWIYASEADVYNIVLFGCTAKQWREVNMERHLNGENIRDMASLNELAILSHIQSVNSFLIEQGVEQKERLKLLYKTVTEQRKALGNLDIIHSIKRLSDNTYVEELTKVE